MPRAASSVGVGCAELVHFTLFFAEDDKEINTHDL